MVISKITALKIHIEIEIENASKSETKFVTLIIFGPETTFWIMKTEKFRSLARGAQPNGQYLWEIDHVTI